MSLPRLYVSSKLRHRDMWLNSGLPVISSWIQQGKLTNVTDFDNMWSAYFEELRGCTGLVLYLEPGEVPKGALIELGSAMVMDRPIIIVWAGRVTDLEEIVGTVIYHRNVTIVKTLKDIVL